MSHDAIKVKIPATVESPPPLQPSRLEGSIFWGRREGRHVFFGRKRQPGRFNI